MIRLQSLIFEDHDRFDELLRQNHSVQEWRRYWFRNRQHLRQAIFTWKQQGILSDEHYESIVSTLQDMDQFFKDVATQSSRMMGGGIGPHDFADGP